MPSSAETKPAATAADVNFAVPDITEAEIAEVVRVLRSGWITTGSETFALEEELREYTSARHVVAVSSCTAGLRVLLASLDLPDGARVAVPNWTFASTAIVPLHLRLTPVLIDVDPETLCVSPEALASAAKSGLDAAMIVQFGGHPVDEQVYHDMERAGIPVVEDAAHAIGTRDHRGIVAGQGTVGAAYSFYATKNLTSGEGGAIATDRTDVATFARSYRQHGMSREAWRRYALGNDARYELEQLGIKANLPDVLAALRRVQLRRFDTMQAKRRALVERYRSLLTDLPSVRALPREQHPGSANHLFVVLLPNGVDRPSLVAAMTSQGIGTSVHFRPLHRFPLLDKHCEKGPAGVDAAERLADRVLSLPLHPRVSPSDAQRVVESLAQGIASQGL